MKTVIILKRIETLLVLSLWLSSCSPAATHPPVMPTLAKPAFVATVPPTDTATAIPSPTATRVPVAPSVTHTQAPPLPDLLQGLVPPDASLRLNKGAVQAMVLAPDGKTVFVASRIILCSYGIADGRENWCILAGNLPEHPIQNLSISPKGDTLAIELLSGGIEFWDSATGAQKMVIQASFTFTSNLAWSPDGRQIAFGDGDGSIQILESHTGKNAGSFRSGEFSTLFLQWTPDGSELITGDSSGSVSLWKPAFGQLKLQQAIIPQTHFISGIALSPDGSELAVGSTYISCYENCSPTYDGSIVLLDAHTLKILRQTRVGKAVNSLAYSPDGTRFLTVLNWQEIGLFNQKNGARLPAKFLTSSIAGAAWQPDNQHVLIANTEDYLHLWNTANSQSSEIQINGYQSINSLAWSPDNLYLATISSLGQIGIWDTRTGEKFPPLFHGPIGRQVE